MKAVRVLGYKQILADGTIIQAVIWQVPQPVPPSSHSYKYRLVYVVNGVRVIGFDNERGKGDHMHRHGTEYPYQFTGIRKLMDDFEAAITTERGEAP